MPCDVISVVRMNGIHALQHRWKKGLVCKVDYDEKEIFLRIIQLG